MAMLQGRAGVVGSGGSGREAGERSWRRSSVHSSPIWLGVIRHLPSERQLVITAWAFKSLCC